MKKLLFIVCFFVSLSCISAKAQTVEVKQDFIDDCTKAFVQVVELRDTVEKFKAERAKTEIERQTSDTLIKGLNDLIAIKDRTISEYAKLTEFQEKIIGFQQQIIEKLQSMLNKPKSAFQKFLKGALEVIKVAVYVTIGKGLAGF